MSEVGQLASRKLGGHRLEWRKDDTGIEGIIVRASGHDIWVPVTGSRPDADWRSEIEKRLDQSAEDRTHEGGENTV